MKTLQLTINPTNLSVETRGRSRQTVSLPALPNDGRIEQALKALSLHFDPPDLPTSESEALETWTESEGGIIVVGRNFGKQLFALLFPSEDMRTSYYSVRESAANEGLRIIIEFAFDESKTDSVVSTWASLPWELIADPESDDFVALRPNTSLVRRLAAGAPVVGQPRQGSCRIR